MNDNLHPAPSSDSLPSNVCHTAGDFSDLSLQELFEKAAQIGEEAILPSDANPYEGLSYEQLFELAEQIGSK